MYGIIISSPNSKCHFPLFHNFRLRSKFKNSLCTNSSNNNSLRQFWSITTCYFWFSRKRRICHLFEADGVGLRLAVLSQVELSVELLGEVTVTSFSKQSDLSVELHASFEHVLQKTHTESLICDVISGQTKNQIYRKMQEIIPVSNLRRAVFGDPDIIGGDSFHTSILMKQHL